eukprot:1832755-Rhodomonas_salina.4
MSLLAPTAMSSSGANSETSPGRERWVWQVRQPAQANGGGLTSDRERPQAAKQCGDEGGCRAQTPFSIQHKRRCREHDLSLAGRLSAATRAFHTFEVPALFGWTGATFFGPLLLAATIVNQVQMSACNSISMALLRYLPYTLPCNAFPALLFSFRFFSCRAVMDLERYWPVDPVHRERLLPLPGEGGVAL